MLTGYYQKKKTKLQKEVRKSRDLEGRRMGIAANSSPLTKLSFVIKNLKNSHCANLLANRKRHLLFTLSQSKADM